MATKRKTILAYGVYGVLLCLGLLYFTFPAQTAGDYLKALVNRADPSLLLEVGDVRPALPFGFKLTDVRITRKGTPGAVFDSKDTRIRPAIMDFLRGASGCFFNSNAYGGTIEGVIHFAGKGTEWPFSLNVDLDNIHIEEYEYLSLLAGGGATGVLSGKIIYDGIATDGGEADITVRDGRIGIQEPLFSLDEIVFEDVSAKILIKGPRVELPSLELTGRDVHGTVSGSMMIQDDIMESRLDLKGAMELVLDLPGEWKEAPEAAALLSEPLMIHFTVKGTVKEPKLNLL